MSRASFRLVACACTAAALTTLTTSCHDLSNFSTVSGGYYEGPVVSAAFVRTGIGDSRMCLTIDPSELEASPGALSTNDGLFHRTPLRSIPQLWQDPLSTFTFGEGRIQNALYVARGNVPDAGVARGEAGAADAGLSSEGGDVFVVISFMIAGDVEVRLLRGAPPAPASAPSSGPPNLFGVFVLQRGSGTTCPY